MFVGNLSALQQTNPVRLLAYSSIAQAGFILAPIAVANITNNFEDGVYASVTYLIIYAFMNIGAFLVINLLQRNIDSENMYDWGGLAKETPLAGIFAVIFSSLLQDSTSWRMVCKICSFQKLTKHR